MASRATYAWGAGRRKIHTRRGLAAGWENQLAELDVLILDQALLEPAKLDVARHFIERGGGLLIAVTGWGWAQTHPGRRLREDLPANQLLAPMGLSFAGATTTGTKDGLLAVEPLPDPLLHAAAALNFLTEAGKHPPNEELLQGEAGRKMLSQTAQASQTLLAAVPELPQRSAVSIQLQRLSHANATAVPTEQAPLRSSDGLARVVLAVQYNGWQNLRAEEVRASPAAASFPGTVPGGSQAPQQATPDRPECSPLAQHRALRRTRRDGDRSAGERGAACGNARANRIACGRAQRL